MTPQPLADNLSPPDPARLAQSIRDWGRELGFQQVGISDIKLSEHKAHLQRWLEVDYHDEMDYMVTHGNKRSRPAELIPGTLRMISPCIDYLPGDIRMAQVPATPEKTYVSRYVLGRDYHRLIRKCLQQLAECIQAEVGLFGLRAFVDSAPALEKAIAEQAGLGWISKNTLALDREAGSYFLLSELFVDMPPPVDPAMGSEHCGHCLACLDTCSTATLVGPCRLDARRYTSYLTIEYKGAIPLELQSLTGNWVFNCGDYQIVYPWNHFARSTGQSDFQLRRSLDNAKLTELLLWSKEGFLGRTKDSPPRRAGYERWLRNLAVGPGNAPSTIPVLEVPKARRGFPLELVREHVERALQRHGETQPSWRLSPGPDGSELDEVVMIATQPDDRLADIVQRQVGVALPEAFADLRYSTRSRLLKGGDVEAAVVEVTFQSEHVPIEEVAVLADAVTADRRATLGHSLFEEGQGLRLGLGRAHGTFLNPLGQAGLAVLTGIPLVRTGEDFLWLMDDDCRSFGQGAEVTIDDDDDHFDDGVPVRIEADHLQVDPDKVLRILYGESLQSLCRVF